MPTPIDGSHHVVRHLPNRLLVRDVNGSVVGIFPQALALKDGEKYLSSTWLEYFQGDQSDQLRGVVAKLKAMPREVKPAHGLGVLSVNGCHTAAQASNVKLRILHEPKARNEAYATIRGIPEDSPSVLNALAYAACVKACEVRSLDC